MVHQLNGSYSHMMKKQSFEACLVKVCVNLPLTLETVQKSTLHVRHTSSSLKRAHSEEITYLISKQGAQQQVNVPFSGCTVCML